MYLEYGPDQRLRAKEREDGELTDGAVVEPPSVIMKLALSLDLTISLLLQESTLPFVVCRLPVVFLTL